MTKTREILEKFVAGISEIELQENYSKQEIDKAKIQIKSNFDNFEVGLEYHRLNYLYKKNFTLGDFRECRVLQNRISEISGKRVDWNE